MFRFSTLALLLTSAVASVSDCSKGTSLFKVTSMSFLPDPTVPGQNSTLYLSMNIPEQIDDGTATYKVSLNYVTVSKTSEKLCHSVSCPIMPGALSTVSTYPVSGIPAGLLNVNIQWADLRGRNLLCVSISTKIRSRSIAQSSGLVLYTNNLFLHFPMCPLHQNMTYKGIAKSLQKYKKLIKNTVKNITNSRKLRGLRYR